MIEVENVSFGYEKNRPVLDALSLTVKPGEIVNLLGPNGSGKSTLLKTILGILPANAGTIRIDGMDIRTLGRARMSRLLSYVPQNHNGVFNYAVLDVVLMGRTVAQPWYTFSSDDYAIAHDALKKVRMEHFATRSYLHLSGGERQLVLIARALAQGAHYFIMDEPVSSLDYGNQFYLLETIRELSETGAGEGGTIFMLTTHHPEHAIFLGGRAVLMQQGKIVADGSVQDVITSSDICSLYGLQPEFLNKITHIYGKHNGITG